jgi:hypothetical protein
MKTPVAGTVFNPFLYHGTDAQLQRFLLTGIVVAGKVARQQQDKLEDFLFNLETAYNYFCPLKIPGVPETPFGWMRQVIEVNPTGARHIDNLLRDVKMGQYSRITPAFTHLATNVIDLRKCTRDELVAVPGIGFKTASFFILFTRKNAEIACLDTHILAFMRETGLAPHAPKTSPQNHKQYYALEKIFVDYCKAIHRPVGEVDFEIWLKRNRGDKRIVNEH